MQDNWYCTQGMRCVNCMAQLIQHKAEKGDGRWENAFNKAKEDKKDNDVNNRLSDKQENHWCRHPLWGYLGFKYVSYGNTISRRMLSLTWLEDHAIKLHNLEDKT